MANRRIIRLQEILKHFPESYVLIDHCRFNDRGRLTHGFVCCSTPDRDTVYQALRDHPNSVIIYTGPVDEDTDGAFLDSGRVWEKAAIS
ncbi:MAG: hypothetical protein ACE5GW_05965 [Planctomycetota bacterium]